MGAPRLYPGPWKERLRPGFPGAPDPSRGTPAGGGYTRVRLGRGEEGAAVLSGRRERVSSFLQTPGFAGARLQFESIPENKPQAAAKLWECVLLVNFGGDRTVGQTPCKVKEKENNTAANALQLIKAGDTITAIWWSVLSTTCSTVCSLL